MYRLHLAWRRETVITGRLSALIVAIVAAMSDMATFSQKRLSRELNMKREVK